MKLAILDDYQRLALEYADWKSLHDVEVVAFNRAFSSTEEAAEKLKPFEIVCLMRERTPFPRALIEKLPNLKFVSLTGARSPSLDTQALKERGIPVSNTRSAGGGLSTVELTWGLIIAAARGLAKGERNMRSGRWHEELGPGFSLSGKRLGLLGLGNIGARVAAIGKAFGMECVAWSTNLTPEKAQSAGARCVSKNELFEKSDVLTIHLVLGDRTRGLVSQSDLQRMKPGAILVNTSRGPIIDEAALIAWLKKNSNHAALDVYEREPLPADHPLRRMENVTLSPHLGYVHEDNYRIFYGDTVENVAAWLAGKPIRVING
ncbi:MAG TPA: D-2-hydroxyacid dehydrogenase family protein [Burkholderiales bacterium]|nr:D-2-hydroxyacid dehydrogenase family protein [Burkholderiales bacterium]